MLGGTATTLFTLPQAIDELIVAVNSITSNYVTITRFNDLLVANSTQTSLLTEILANQNGLTQAINNLTLLVEVLIQGLNGVATANLQNQEITMLQEVLQQTSNLRPRQIVLDLPDSTSVPQKLPTRRGP